MSSKLEVSTKDILDRLSPQARELTQRVLQLEREHLHVKNPSLLPSKIVEAAKELAR
ncbi:hypothetical protein [Streptodolium elevatio]